MKTQRNLMIAGLLATQLCAIAPAFAQDPSAQRVQLERIVVVGKKVNAAPVVRLEPIVVVGHRSQVNPVDAMARNNIKVVWTGANPS